MPSSDHQQRTGDERHVAVVEESQHGMQLFDFLGQVWPDVDRAVLRRLVLDGQVAVGAAETNKLRFRLKSGDVLQIALPCPVDQLKRFAAAAGNSGPALQILHEDDAVIVVKGKGKRRKKKAKKATKSEVTPAKQRAAARRLAELWLLHLRERLRGAPGLAGLPSLGDLATGRLARHIERVQSFQERLVRNPNVRLALEETLLELSE